MLEYWRPISPRNRPGVMYRSVMSVSFVITSTNILKGEFWMDFRCKRGESTMKERGTSSFKITIIRKKLFPGLIKIKCANL